MHCFSPVCPVCDKTIPMSWRIGLRKPWGACPHCGIVLVEKLSRKATCFSLVLLSFLFMRFGERWLESLVARGALGLAAILVARLFLPGFEVRNESHSG